MKTCPYCAESIRSSATTCPYCEMDLRRKRRGSGSTRPARQSTAAKVSGDVAKWVLIVVLGLGGVAAVVGLLAALLLPAVFQAREAAARQESQNNLKVMGLAMHGYHDSWGHLPAGGVFDEEGRPLHGWQAALLPYIDQGPLYNMIDFQRPWDDPANKPLFQHELKAYLNPSLQETRSSDGYGLSHYAGNARLLNVNTEMKFTDIPDGLSTTILAGEVSQNLKPWGHPTNFRDPAQGIASGPDSFGRADIGSGYFLFADGAVRAINKNIDPKLLEALSTPDGGEQVGSF
jgi:type II secretory pathway pseudopilin PulG